MHKTQYIPTMFPQEFKERGDNSHKKWCELQSGKSGKLSRSLATNTSLAGADMSPYWGT